MKIRPSGYFNQLFPSAETRTTYIKEGAVPHEKAELCKTEVLDHAKVYDLLVAYNAPAEEIKHKKQALEKAMDAFRKEFPKGFYQLTLPHRSIEIKLGKESIFVNKIAPEEFASPVFEKFFTSGMKETKQEVKSIVLTEIVISDIFLNEGDAKSDRVVLQAFAEYLDVGVGPAFKEWSFKQILTLFYTINFLFPGNNPVFSEPAFVERICTVESCFRSILELAEEQHTLIAARAVPEEIKQLQKALGQAMDAFGKEFPKEFRQLAVPHHCLEIKLGKSSIFINKAAPTQFKSSFIQKFFCAGMRESRQAVKTINLAKYVLSDALSEEGDAASDRMVLEAFADYIDHGVVPELKKWSYLQILTLFYVAQAFCHEENDPLLDKVLTVDLGTFMGQALARNKGFSMHIRAVRFSDSPLPSSLGYPSEEIRRTEKQEFLELIPLKPIWKSLDFSGLELRGNGYNFVNDEFIMAVSANCSNLRILNLSNSLITDKGLQVMAKKCPGVISVKQSGYGKIKIEISPAKAPGYHSINLNSCKAITDKGLKALVASSPDLTSINLYGCQNLTAEGIEFLVKKCPNLTVIDLGNCKKVTYRGLLASAQHGTDLTSLELHFNNHSVKSIALGQLMSNCPKLIKINLSLCEISDADFASLPKNCPKLTAINLSHNRQLTDKGLRTLVEKFPDLESIDLTGCLGITNAGIRILVENCKGLKEIKLNYCVKIDDGGLTYIAQNCAHLTLIELRECSISSLGLEYLAKSNRRLSSIDLYRCKINDRGLEALAKYCRELSSIGLHACQHITSEGIVTLAGGCKKLEKVDIGQCMQILEYAIGTLLQQCPELEYLTIYSGLHQL